MVASVWVPRAYINAILTLEMLTKPYLLVMSVLGINQISHSRDVVDLLHLVTECITWYAKVSLIFILLRKNLM